MKPTQISTRTRVPVSQASGPATRMTLSSTVMIAAMTAMTSTAASAQTAPPSPPAADEPAQQITISASRIERLGYSAPTPTTVVGAALLEQRATVNIVDVLNEIPAFRATTTPSAGGLGNTGQFLVDLRGLTPQRTLVLLDRNRLPAMTLPGTGQSAGTTDLSIVPTILIRNVEVVTGGASAAYGSDAVAGVVNVQINDKLEGIKGNVQYGATRYGDAKDTFAALAGGLSFAGGAGHFVAGGEYNKNDGTGALNNLRDWGKQNYGVLPNLPGNRAAGLPANIIAPTAALYAQSSSGGVVQTAGPLANLAFVKGANGTVTAVPFTPGTIVVGSFATFSDAALAANAAAGIDNGYYQQLRPAIERTNFLSKLSYQFNDNLNGYIEPLVSRIQNTGILIQRRDGAGAGPALRLQKDNPYLQQALTPAQLALVPGFTPGNTQFGGGLSIGYLGNQFGPAVSQTTYDTRRVLTGLKGTFGDSGSWDVAYQDSTNKAKRSISNAFNNTNFRNAIDAVQVGSQVVCRSAAAGCQPLNILGQPSGSDAAFAYVLGTATGETVTRLKEFSANLQGEPFSLWAGPVSVGGGVETRKESLGTTTDPLSQAGVWLTGAGASLPEVQQEVKEVYVETVVPLLKGAPMAKSLDFNGAVRRTDYSTSGTVSTWKMGLTWQPVSDIRFRGTRSRDIRAPNLADLYTPITGAAPIPTDPRTALSGVPAMTALPTSGGNPILKPESSDTLALGIVLQPSSMKRLNASADYYRINVKGAITSTSAQAVVNNCLPGGVYNGSPYCSLITFAGNDVVHGQITAVSAALANVGEFRTHGVDMQVSYAQPLKELMEGLNGTLNVNVQGTRVFEYWTSVDVTSATPNGVNRAGQTGAVFGGPAGLPKWMWTTSLDYKLDRFSVNGQLRYISAGHQDNSRIGPDDADYSSTLVNSINTNSVPSYTLVNLGASYDFGSSKNRREVYVAINNALDRAPPLPANGTAYYDLLGRAYKVGFRFSF